MRDDERIKYEQAIADLSQTQKQLEHREKLLQSLNEAAALLIANESDHPVETIRKCMEMIGDYVEIDRINIWKTIEHDGESQHYRDLGWESDIIAKTIPLAENMSTYPYMRLNEDWDETLKGGGVVNAVASELRPKVYARLKPVGVQSILFVPVYIQGEYWGYVSFDDCHSPVLFSDEEVDILRSSSLLMASALMRTELTAQLIQAREDAVLGAKVKSDFLASMSHEMRTPLNAVIGMTSIGKNATSVERKNYCFGKIEDASKHLLGVINDVLDMSKIEANKLELSEVTFEFERMLQHVVNVSAFRIEEKKQHFMVYIDSDIPETLIGDDQRLSQIITNLLSNAVKFTPEGGSIDIDTKLLSADEGIYTIQFEVRDTGIGISKEGQSKLFASFQQASAETSRNFGGTGLGLNISKRIVELMGGAIRVESELGKGSSFIFTVKLKKAVEETGSRKLGEDVTPQNLRILFVDDDNDIREYFDDIAARLGFECRTAESGEQALDIIATDKPYDMFFVDWKLPGIDGLELSKRIREKSGPQAVITLVSGYELSDVEEKAKEAGVDHFLPKPLFPSPVADLIAEYLGIGSVNEPAPGVSDTENFDGARILLADDVEINREIVLTLLEPMALIIDTAETGKEALEMFSSDPFAYELILMDVQMPEMDGLEATRAIRELAFDRAKEIPIIAMTANVFTEDIAQCLEAGMNEHLGKPLNLDDLVAVLRKYIR